MDRPIILCLNLGSSTLKYAVFAGEECLARDTVDDLDAVLAALSKQKLSSVAAVGHRIVHGGADHAEPELIDDRLLDELRKLVPFAPLHLPPEIELIENARGRLRDAPHVACFDTAFHRRMPLVAQRLPLREELWDEGIRRYGFHGLSYESVIDSMGGKALGRAVIAHLGNGSSLCAVKDGEPMDTTMGFTPTGGCVMGTRSGDLDPGVLVHLVEHRRYDAKALDRLVNREAGLAGISGKTSDMRALLAARDSDPKAALAIDVFCYSVRKHVGALAAVLGGLDNLVFTGGIGEHAAPIREEIARGLEHLGAKVHVVASDEERMIARHTSSRTTR